MKIPALITVLALACGAAYANTPAADGTTKHSAATTASADAPKKPGLLERTKRGMHRMGDKMRHASHRKGPDETTAMGAPASEPTMDSDRRARMDQAYDNWKSKQK